MTNQMRNTVVASLMALATLGVIGAGVASAQDLVVTGAWLRPTGARPMTGAFLVIENRGTAERVLVSGSTPAAGKVELHEMKTDGGMMRMAPVPQIVVPAKGKVELKPGGLHLMLFDVKSKLSDGDTIPLALTFKDGATLKTQATVRAEEGQRKPGMPLMTK